jgi:hypothetical protein
MMGSSGGETNAAPETQEPVATAPLVPGGEAIEQTTAAAAETPIDNGNEYVFDWRPELGEANENWGAYEVFDAQGNLLEIVPTATVGNPVPLSANTPEGVVAQYISSFEASVTDWDSDGNGSFETDTGLEPFLYQAPLLKDGLVGDGLRQELNAFDIQYRGINTWPLMDAMRVDMRSAIPESTGNDSVSFHVSFVSDLVLVDWLGDEHRYEMNGVLRGTYDDGIEVYDWVIDNPPKGDDFR